MKQQKSHARIHQVILQLRQKTKKQDIIHQINTNFKQNKKYSISGTATMENSEILSKSYNKSQTLTNQDSYQLGQKNLYKIQSIISSQTLSSQKQQKQISRRQVKTARPVSRRKITSKDKYSKTFNEKQEGFKIDIKKSDIFQQLQNLDPKYFIEEKNEDKQNQLSNQPSQLQNIKAFWAENHIFVSLFPIQYTQCIVYNHPNILPVYGQVTLRNRRYIVSNQYKHSSLKDLIKQFGPFEQNLCKKYIFQVVCGLEEMHHRKVAHNRLCSQNILYNKEGQIFINVVKSTSRPLTDKQKQQNLFQYSPQILLTKNKSNSLRSDVWSLGIILLDMLFNFGSFNSKFLKFHPYNLSEDSLQKNDSIIVDNLKQLYPKNFQSKSQKQIIQKINTKYSQLSVECKDFISKCLALNKENRPNIKQIKSHKFFT